MLPLTPLPFTFEVRRMTVKVKVRRATPAASRAVSLTAAAYERWMTAFLCDRSNFADCCSVMSWQAGLGQRSQLHSTAAETDVTDTLVQLNNSEGFPVCACCVVSCLGPAALVSRALLPEESR